MALIKCPECNNDISDKAKSCPKCGYPISEHLAELDGKISETPIKTKIESIKEMIPEEEKPSNNFDLKKNKSVKSKKIKIGVFSIILIILLATLGIFYAYQNISYSNAIKAIENENYDIAKTYLLKLNNYKDQAELLIKVEYLKGIQFYDNGDFNSAIGILEIVRNYEDASKYLDLAKKAKAKELYENKKYEAAIEVLLNISTNKLNIDDRLILNNSYAELCKSLMKLGNYKDAISYIDKCKDYSDWNALKNELYYKYTTSKINEIDENTELNTYDGIFNSLLKIDASYLDIAKIRSDFQTEWKIKGYNKAIEYYNKKFFYEAKIIFERFPSYKDTQKYLNSYYLSVEGSYSSYKNQEVNYVYKLLPEGKIRCASLSEYYPSEITYYWNFDKEYSFGMSKETDYLSTITSIKKDKLTIDDNGHVDELYKISDNIWYTLPEAKKLSRAPSIGMTTDEVRASKWGNPEDINRTTTMYGTSEQWVYSSSRYIYFDDGIVTSIQD